MMPHRQVWAFAAAVVVAAGLRFPGLALRPMHADEAVHAAKMGRLLEQGRYEYDPQEYHGPTLNYLTLLPARMRGATRYQDLDEVMLRIVPAAIGVLLVAAQWFLVPLVGFRPAAFAALLTAVSPAMVFYSRYYIQETLLVAFSFGALVSIARYLQSVRNPADARSRAMSPAIPVGSGRHSLLGLGWAVSAGVCFGLMFATKETWVIAAGSMAAALGLALALGRPTGAGACPEGARREAAGSGREAQDARQGAEGAGGQAEGGTPDRGWLAWHLAAGVAAAVGVSGLFFSSFLNHPRGVVDSVRAFSTYLQRAGGSASWHTHPWYYYFGLLLYSRTDGGPVWTEAGILALAVAGLATWLARGDLAGTNRTVLGLFGFYAVLMVITYASLPYKTPWCLLGFLHGLILLAGVGATRLLDWSRGIGFHVSAFRLRRPASRSRGPGAERVNAALGLQPMVAVLVAGVVAHLGWQAWAGSFRFEADPRNPYVYAHTSTDVFEITRRIEAVARAHPQGLAMPLEVISGENLWPLPWYLRCFSRVLWERDAAEGVPPAPVIVTTPDMEAAVARRLYERRPPGERELYVNIFDRPLELRPQVEVRGFASKTLWDEFRESTAPAPPPQGAGR